MQTRTQARFALLPLLATLLPVLRAQEPAIGGTVRAPLPTPANGEATPPEAAPPRAVATADAPIAEPPHRAEPTLRRPHSRIELALGGGRFRHDTEGAPTLQDDTDGGYARLAFEYINDEGNGGGARIEGMASDDDLFQDTAGTPVEASDGELFLHFSHLVDGDAVRMPLRIGLAFRGYKLDDPAGADLTWSSIGPRLEIEPDVRLIENEALRWSLYGRIGLFVGYTEVETDPSTDTWKTSTFGADFGIGTRLAFEHAEVGIGYLLRTHRAAESDVASSSFIREFDASVRGIEVSFALLF